MLLKISKQTQIKTIKTIIKIFLFKNDVKVLLATKTFVTSNFNNTNLNFQLLIQIDNNKSFISNINNFKNIDKKLFAQKNRNNKNSNLQLRFDSAYVTLNIDFQLINDFIYYIKQLNFRFCVSINCVKNIFKTIHNLNVYSKHYQTYVRFVDIVYIYKMFKLFITYIKHCFSCQFN